MRRLVRPAAALAVLGALALLACRRGPDFGEVPLPDADGTPPSGPPAASAPSPPPTTPAPATATPGPTPGIASPSAPAGDPWRDRVRTELARLPRPAAPPGAAGAHPVDAFLADWWERHGLRRPLPCDDSTFLRRASLDLTGLLPDEREAAAFARDPDPAKRLRLIDRL